MTLLPYSTMKIDSHLRVKVSNHFRYTDFGVRGQDGSNGLRSRHFVCSGTPGTGFFVRESESHSYHEFVRSHASQQPQGYWNMLFGREPSYDRELQRVNEALGTPLDPRKRELLECYANALAVGRIEERMERIVDGVKAKMRHRKYSKHLVSIVSHYRRKIDQLERDIHAAEYDVRSHCDEAVWQAYVRMVEAFDTMAGRCRRVWHQSGKDATRFAQIFFDLGVFDFVRSDVLLPLLRDSSGVAYYLLPDAVVVAHDSVDFDLVPLKTLTVVCQETALVEPSDMLPSHLGDAACMMLIPELGLTFCFNHARVVEQFVHSLDQLKQTL